MRNYILTLLFSSCSLIGYSQGNYSQYGLGEPSTPGFAQDAGAANAFYVNNDSITANILNPASLAELKFTAFNLGISSSIISSSNLLGTGNSSLTSFQNFGLSFPVIKGKWGMSFGVKPLTKSESTTVGKSDHSLLGNVETTNSTTGGLNRVFFANGYTIKGFSFGINASYVFGRISSTTTSNFIEDNLLSAQTLTHNNYRGVNLEYGLQYVKQLEHENALGFGITFSNRTDLDGTQNLIESSFIEAVNFIADTLSSSTSFFDATVPKKISGGIFYQASEKLKFAVSYTNQNWSDLKNGTDVNTLKEQTTYAIGMEFQPNRKDIKKYLNRVKYRFGYKLSDGYISIAGTNIDETGITFGLELPIRNGATKLNFGAELGKRGTTDKSLIQENYAKLYFGLIFNDRWFKKIQYD